jgi:hypothetical protein
MGRWHAPSWATELTPQHISIWRWSPLLALLKRAGSASFGLLGGTSDMVSAMSQVVKAFSDACRPSICIVLQRQEMFSFFLS